MSHTALALNALGITRAILLHLVFKLRILIASFNFIYSKTPTNANMYQNAVVLGQRKRPSVHCHPINQASQGNKNRKLYPCILSELVE